MLHSVRVFGVMRMVDLMPTCRMTGVNMMAVLCKFVVARRIVRLLLIALEYVRIEGCNLRKALRR